MVKLATLNNGPLQKAHSKLNDEERGNDKRNYLGMSIIGHKCHRFLQFVHYGTFTKKYFNEIFQQFLIFQRRHSAQLRQPMRTEAVG